jgi:hypothetical protein
LPQDELLIRKERRNYRKRRHKAGTVGRGGLVTSGPTAAISPSPATGATSAAAAAAATAASLASRGLPSCLSDAQSVGSSEDEAGSAVAASQSDAEEAESDLEKQGPFAFRRKLHCNYLAVSLVNEDRFLPEFDSSGLVMLRRFRPLVPSKKLLSLLFVKR